MKCIVWLISSLAPHNHDPWAIARELLAKLEAQLDSEEAEGKEPSHES